jgi:hypothetical protein
LKKLTAIALILILAFALAACDAKNAVQNAVRGAVSGGGASEEADDNDKINAQDSAKSAAPPENGPEPALSEADDDNGGLIAEADAIGVTVENERIVLKYIGEELEYGAPRQYWIMEGFEEDGAMDIWGTCRFWYFYDDAAAYEAGLAKATESMGEPYIKEQNKTSLFFATSGVYTNEWETFGDVVGDVDGGTVPINMYPTADYQVVR